MFVLPAVGNECDLEGQSNEATIATAPIEAIVIQEARHSFAARLMPPEWFVSVSVSTFCMDGFRLAAILVETIGYTG
jgi:hypothetical protein